MKTIDLTVEARSLLIIAVSVFLQKTPRCHRAYPWFPIQITLPRIVIFHIQASALMRVQSCPSTMSSLTRMRLWAALFTKWASCANRNWMSCKGAWTRHRGQAVILVCIVRHPLCRDRSTKSIKGWASAQTDGKRATTSWCNSNAYLARALTSNKRSNFDPICFVMPPSPVLINKSASKPMK